MTEVNKKEPESDTGRFSDWTLAVVNGDANIKAQIAAPVVFAEKRAKKPHCCDSCEK